MDNMERLQEAENMLVANKRAGAIQEIIDVCRLQQLQINGLQQRFAELRHDTSTAVANNQLLGSFGLDGD